MNDQNNIINSGDYVRVRSGRHAGQIGSVINITWISNQFGAYARVQVSFDGEDAANYSMGNLEKVKDTQAVRAMKTSG